MTINEIELYDVEAVDEVLSHLSNRDANVIQEAISSLCGMVTIRDKYIKELKEKILQAGNILDAKTITEYETNVFQVVSKILLPTKDGQILLEDDILQRCYIVLKEGEYMVQIADPKVAEELLHMNVSKAHEQMAELIKTERRRALEIKVYGEDN